MRVLLQSESYWPNQDGGARFEHWLAHELLKHGHDVAIVAPGRRMRAYVEHDGGSLIFRTPSAHFPPLAAGYTISYRPSGLFCEAVDTFRPDVIHVNTMWFSANRLLSLARDRGIPIVATNHLMPENVLLNIGKVAQTRLMKQFFWHRLASFHNRFDAVTSPTPSATKLLLDSGLARPLYDISNGVDIDYYRPLSAESVAGDARHLDRLHIPDDFVLYVGRVAKEKNLGMLVRSFAVIAGKTAADLVIAGCGNASKEILALTRLLGIGNRVHLTGHVSDDEKLALARRAKVFAITSQAELQSVASLEALACGLPLVAVNAAALKELCRDGDNGYLVPVGDIGGFAGALLKVLEDDGRRKRFGSSSRRLVSEGHSLHETFRKFGKLYECALAGEFPAIL